MFQWLVVRLQQIFSADSSNISKLKNCPKNPLVFLNMKICHLENPGSFFIVGTIFLTFQVCSIFLLFTFILSLDNPWSTTHCQVNQNKCLCSFSSVWSFQIFMQGKMWFPLTQSAILFWNLRKNESLRFYFQNKTWTICCKPSQISPRTVQKKNSKKKEQNAQMGNERDWICLLQFLTLIL